MAKTKWRLPGAGALRPRIANLAERARADDKAAKPENAQDDVPPTALVLREGDWPEFRGPNRQGEVHGVQIATDWNAAPPKQLWRQKIGPAWSSVVIIGDRLFTQEQRGENEVVVCLDTATGHEIWSHEDAARFFRRPGRRWTTRHTDVLRRLDLFARGDGHFELPRRRDGPCEMVSQYRQ